MLIRQNFFTEEELSTVLNLYSLAETNKVWKISRQDWSPELIKGHKGYCRIAAGDFDLLQLITKKIEILFPRYTGCSMSVYYHKWPFGSAINAHRDNSKLFGATVYLNQEWDDYQGGLFYWRDKDTETQHCFTPRLNTIVLNDREEWHWVSQNIGIQTRKTLQIWGYL